VGANRSVSVAAATVDHGLRLLRSHAGGAGPVVAPEIGRAMLLVRLNQLAAGGAGVAPQLLVALAAAVNDRVAPPIRRYGAIGTGDLTALASAALCLLGERPWLEGTTATFALDDADALAFISSNAATIGEAALACHDMRRLADAALIVAALSSVAVSASTEPYAEAVQAARPHPGQDRVAGRLRALLGEDSTVGRRIQDPYGFRALPQVHGPTLDALDELDAVLSIDMNAAAENPLVDVAGSRVLHNGNFHAEYLALALDKAAAALARTAALSVTRLANLLNPAITGAAPFLADGTPGSSGLLILEYIAHAALADLRHAALPAPAGPATLSLGTEDHASFATQAAQRAGSGVPAYAVVVACELLAATRALRHNGGPMPDGLRDVYDRVAAAIDPRADDHALDGDLDAIAALLPDLETSTH
jgi:histidine ammonia-lyase